MSATSAWSWNTASAYTPARDSRSAAVAAALGRITGHGLRGRLGIGYLSLHTKNGKLILLGLDDAGPTTLLHCLKTGQYREFAHTTSDHVEKVTIDRGILVSSVSRHLFQLLVWYRKHKSPCLDQIRDMNRRL